MSNIVSQDIIQGVVEHITYYHETNHYCVLQVKTTDKKMLTVTGTCPQVAVGESIKAQGSLTVDKRYGQQFKATAITSMPPCTTAGIEKYLGSGLVYGIGPQLAKTLVKTFGTETLNVLEHDCEKLLKVPGIGKMRYEQLKKSWQSQQSIRNIIIFLHDHGLGTARAYQIYKIYGENSIHTIRRNPYVLSYEVRGIGFKLADQVAKKCGIADDAEIRIEAALRHVINKAIEEGHCGMEETQLIEATHECVAVDTNKILAGCKKLVSSQVLTAKNLDDKTIYFSTQHFQWEQSIAKHIRRLQHTRKKQGHNFDPMLFDSVARSSTVTLSDEQLQAIQSSLTEKVSIITGGPGVGKTTIIKQIVAYAEKSHMKTALCAPTGRAAKRMAQSCRYPATTIHRLLEIAPPDFRFKYNEHCPLKVDLVIIDETSMIDISLMHYLLQALPDHTCVVFVGDIDQLPSVGAGNVLKDLIDAHVITYTTLNTIFRQHQYSQITSNAHRINQGKMPQMDHHPQSDFFFIASQPENIVPMITHLVSSRIPAKFNLDPIHDIQVLTAMHRGSIGAQNLNTVLQQALNREKTHLECHGKTFFLGDKVIQMSNNYDKKVFNGDIGIISSMDCEQRSFTVDFGGNHLVHYTHKEADELNLSYAITIHKSQGSEYPVVVIPIAMQNYVLLMRNLVYTGVTRGKKLVVLVGEKKALAMAVNNDQRQKRLTYLRHLLQGRS